MAYKKMEPAVKREWLRLLRSGQFPQGQGYLVLREGWCCLGLLCLIAVKYGVMVPYRIEQPARTIDISQSNVSMFRDLDGAFQESFPGTPTNLWAGLDEKASQKLADMNDIGFTFSAIADWIEAHL